MIRVGWKLCQKSAGPPHAARPDKPAESKITRGNFVRISSRPERRFLNVRDENDLVLMLAWLIAAFRPRGPYPILALHGEQGTAKSTTGRVLRAVIDPNAAPLRTAPRDERDLMIAATNGWVVAYDNLSVYRTDPVERVMIPVLTRDIPGYRITPHTDTHWKGITVQLYLPPDASAAHIGTIFHDVLPDGSMPKAAQMRFAPNSGYAFAVGDNTWHSADPVGGEVKTRDSILLTYFVDAGLLRFLRNRGKRVGNFVLNEVRQVTGQ